MAGLGALVGVAGYGLRAGSCSVERGILCILVYTPRQPTHSFSVPPASLTNASKPHTRQASSLRATILAQQV